MRNLKRVLALAMAMIMMLGMMVIGTSAASYKDAETISDEYAEAVAVLTGMGVFKGTDATESVFAPKAILSRAEAATLIYRVITSDVTDKQVKNYDYASLKDVQAGKWYTGYVTYANNGGYIKGDENGNFNPTADVTGIQVLAIMLRAAGYGQNGEYEGSAWKDNVLTDAKDLKIIEGISTATLNSPATRELVAQLIFNAMYYVKMVSYNNLLGYVPVKWTDMASANQTLGEKNFTLKDATKTDEWGRPYYGYTYKTGDKATYFVEDHTTYSVAISDCDVAADMGLKKNATVTEYKNGVKGTTDINVYNQNKENGAQGTVIEVYEDRLVIIDTYLAVVTDVTAQKADKNGHVIIPASTDLKVYYAKNTVLDMTIDGADYEEDDVLLVNVNEGATDAKGNYLYTKAAQKDFVATVVDYADSFTGTQTAQYLRADKHEIDETDYMDAVHFYLDAASNNKGEYLWYMDQFGNLIGSANLPADPSSYGVIKSIQWINERGSDGYATAFIVDMEGNETEMTVVSIDGCKTTYMSKNYEGPAAFDRTNNKAYISTNITENYFVYAGLDLYEITTVKGGVALQHVYTKDGQGSTLNEEFDGNVWTGYPAIYTYDDGHTVDQILIDNNTQFLFRADAKVGYTFEAVTGYTNVEKYEDCIVDYVLNKNGVAKYVYVIGEPEAEADVDFVYITSASNVKVTLAEKNGDDYYVISNVIRGDGTTDALYIYADETFDRDDLLEWLDASVGKLFVVKTLDGYVGAVYGEIREVWSWDDIPGTWAGYAGKVTTIGSGMIDTAEQGAFNTTKSTVYVNENGVMSASELKKGDFIYVISSYENGTWVADTIFVTDNDVIGTTLANTKASAVKAIEEYAAATVGSSWMQSNYPGITVTVADIQTAIDNLKKAVNDATDVAEVHAAMENYQSVLDQAAIAVASTKKAAADAAAAKAAAEEKVAAAKAVTATTLHVDGTNVEASYLTATGVEKAVKDLIAGKAEGLTVKVLMTGDYKAPAQGNSTTAVCSVTVSAGEGAALTTATFNVTVTVYNETTTP